MFFTYPLNYLQKFEYWVSLIQKVYNLRANLAKIMNIIRCDFWTKRLKKKNLIRRYKVY